MQLKVTAPSIVVDESAHPSARIEWWFVQGFYQGPESGRRDFMSSFFKKAVSQPTAAPRSAHMLLLSLFDLDRKKQQIASVVDSPLIRYYLRCGPKKDETELNRKIIDVLRAELTRYGPPQPVSTETAPVSTNGSPLRISWKDFFLSQAGGLFKLDFVEPGTRRRCRFILRPVHCRLHLDRIELPRGETMEYACYPLLELEGSVGRERVRGQAWLDHQWGNLGWFVSGMDQQRILGWNWFGINLDDGSDLLVMLHRDMKTRRPVCQYAVYLEKGRRAKSFVDFSLVPHAMWESPKTHIRYPLKWHIVIPEMAADLIFEPFLEDQEIPVLGAMRAIWQGVGSVNGTIGGRRVAGRARLELSGYGVFFSGEELWSGLVHRIDRQIRNFLPSEFTSRKAAKFLNPYRRPSEPQAYTAVIARPFWDLMSRRGKRWRAILFILLLEMLGVESARYEDLAAVIAEMPHCGSLIIDDIEDESPIRRGDESIHFRYGLDVAINAANALYFLPHLLLQSHPHLSREHRYEIYQIINRYFVRAHFGQGLDIYWSKNLNQANLSLWSGDSLEAKILESYSQKTAALVMGMAESACVIAGCDGSVRRACVGFARDLGIAFQIIDDVLNFCAPQRLRKKEGEDLARGKLTYVICRAMQSLPGQSRKRLQEIMVSQELRQLPEIQREGEQLIRDSGALIACRDDAWRMLQRGWRNLSREVPSSEPKTKLRVLCSSLIHVPEGKT